MIITVAHQKGGVGKSTISVNLAVVMGADMFDLDKQFSSAEFNACRVADGRPGLLVFTLLEAKCKAKFQTPIPQENMIDVLMKYRRNPKKHIIVDCPGLDHDNIRNVILMADYILTPVATSQVEVWGLQNFEDILKTVELTKGEKIISHILINRADSRAASRLSELRDFIQSDNYVFCKSHISQAVAFQDSFSLGKAVTESVAKKWQKSKNEMQDLVCEIKKDLKIK
jgi:chromosome partitioning protein